VSELAASAVVTAWTSAKPTLCSPHVWPGSPVFRRERHQDRLFDPAASADAEDRAQLEHGADRPAPGDCVRRYGGPPSDADEVIE
jgi:hypothetical protein